MCIGLLFVLLSTVIIASHVFAQDPSDSSFISLDCGRRENYMYKDPTTGIYYSSDEDYIDTGVSRSISPEFKGKYSLPQQFNNVRIFPGTPGTRSCYTLNPKLGNGYKYLIRAFFVYGNYDDKNNPPQFDIYLGVDYWTTYVLTTNYVFGAEILHILTSDYVNICLVNTGSGTPFISVIELRPIPKAMYTTKSGSLVPYVRWDLGSTKNYFIRYQEDVYDRQWKPVTLPNTTISTNTFNSFTQNFNNIPSLVLNTAVQAPSADSYINISGYTGHSTDQIYIFVYFVESVVNASREMVIYLNGYAWTTQPFIPPYQSVYTLVSTGPANFPNYDISIRTTNNSNLPPMINAIEIYVVKQLLHSSTDDNDVEAMISIKTTYGIAKNWQGDPCLPKGFTWIGISCSDNGFEPPNVISLNLSSSGLTGVIATSIRNLSMLQSLDLSYNNLTGPVPDFLSRLPSLKYLNLIGNNFTGTLPPELLKKSTNGSLVLSIGSLSNSTNPCQNRACHKKKKKLFIPVLASIVAVSVVFILTFTLWRKRKTFSAWCISKLESVQVQSNTEDEPFLISNLRRLTYSEISNIIDWNNDLGKGTFGEVYLGLMDGKEVAVKKLNIDPNEADQRYKDFKSEVNILANVNHKNLTSVLGYCNEGTNNFIIFEYAKNGNLEEHISGKKPNLLGWEQRLTIMTGVAEGLEYLHHSAHPPIIHRDIKPSNILLTENFEAKIADFGLSRTCPVGSTRGGGTPGYLDPEYEQNPQSLTEKVDVYSFGVMMLVIITGRNSMKNGKHISELVSTMIRAKNIKRIIDPRLPEDMIADAWEIVKLAMACVSHLSERRPTMNEVVKKLKECSSRGKSARLLTKGFKHGATR